MPANYFTDLMDPWDAADDDEIETQQAKRRRLLLDVQDTFKGKAGLRVLIHLLKKCHLNSTTMTGNSHTYYRIGVEDFGKSLLDLVAAASPDVYLNIHKQRINEIQERELKNQQLAKQGKE